MMRQLRKRLASVSSAVRLRRARVNRSHHEMMGHLVTQTLMRDYRTNRGEFEFYWRKCYECINCSLQWPL